MLNCLENILSIASVFVCKDKKELNVREKSKYTVIQASNRRVEIHVGKSNSRRGQPFKKGRFPYRIAPK